VKILVIEDDQETAAYVVRGLHEHGHVVDIAGTGQDGLFLATGGGHDVLVVDRMLPGVDGLGLVRAMRDTGIKAPALFLTALGGVSDRVVTRTMLLEGVWDFHFDPRANIVETHVSRLCSKISRGGRDPELIHTVRGSGYALRAPNI